MTNALGVPQYSYVLPQNDVGPGVPIKHNVRITLIKHRYMFIGLLAKYYNFSNTTYPMKMHRQLSQYPCLNPIIETPKTNTI